MATERIEELISQKVLETFDQLNTKVNEGTARLEKLIATGVKLNSTIGGVTTFKQFSQEIGMLDKNERDLTKTTEELARAQAKLDQAAAVRRQRDAIQELKLKNLELANAQKELNLQNAKIREQERLAAREKRQIAADEKKANAEAQIAGQERILQLKREQEAAAKLADQQTALDRAEEARLSNANFSNKSTGGTNRTGGGGSFAPNTELERQVHYLQISKGELASNTAQQKALKVALDQGKISQAQYNEQINRAIILEQQLKKSISLQTAEVKRTVAEQTFVKGSLDQRRVALERLQKSYDGLTQQERNQPWGQRLLKITQNLDAQVKGLEATTGRAQRNVGNYGNAFTKGLQQAFSALKYITYILPGIGIAGALGLIFEPIANFVTGLFSASEASKKAAEKLEQQKKAVEELIESYRDFSTITDDAQGNSAAQITRVQSLARAVLDLNLSTEERKRALEQLREVNKSYFGDLKFEEDSLRRLNGVVAEYTNALVQQAIIKEVESDIGKLGAAYFRQQRVVRQAEVAYLAYRDTVLKVNEEDIKRGVTVYDATGKSAKLKLALEAELKTLSPLSKQYNELRDELNQLNLEQLKFKPLDDKSGKNSQAAKAARRRANDEEREDEVKLLKALAENEAFYLVDRLSKRREAYEKEKQLLAEKQADQIAAEKDPGALEQLLANQSYQRVKLEEEANADLLRLKAQYNAKVVDEEKKLSAQLDREGRERLEARRKLIQDEYEDRANQNQQNLSGAVTALNDEFEPRYKAAKGSKEKLERLEREYGQRRADIEYYFAKIGLEQQIKFAEAQIAFEKLQGGDVGEKEKQLADLKMRYSDMALDHIKKNNKDEADNNKEKYDEQIRQLEKLQFYSNKVADLLGGALNAGLIDRKNKLQAEADAVEKNATREIDAINRSTDTEEKKAARIAIVNAKKQAQQEEIERKQRKLDQQKAQFDKARAIAEIVISTALAVVKALRDPGGTAGIALAKTIGAFGAAELAIAVATPIPKFEDGTLDSGPVAQKALVGEKRSELMVGEDGKLTYIPKGPKVMNVPKHSIIFPDAQEALEAGIGRGRVVSLSKAERDMAYMLAGKMDTLNRTVKNKSEFHLYPKKDGWERIKKSGGNTSRYI